MAVSTVSLFCRKLRLAGVNDFKLELARAWKAWSTLPITVAWESSGRISPVSRPTLDPAGSAARASSSLKSLPLSSQDVVLYFSHSGATHEVLEAAEIIRRREARLILVTRYLNSPASAYADNNTVRPWLGPG